MTGAVRFESDLRDRLLKAPETILNDPDLMRALVGASEQAMGENIVDIRGLAMDRLEAQLGRLEDTHQSVIAAAYENLSGMHAVHRAVLELLEARDFVDLLGRLSGPATDCLRVDGLRMLIESRASAEAAPIEARFPILRFVEPGYVEVALEARGARPDRTVILGETRPAGPMGPGSEAVIRLDLGAGRPALLILSSDDPAQFRPGQATDLLAFLGGVVERVLGRWLR